MTKPKLGLIPLAVAAAATMALSSTAFSAADTTVAKLAATTHFHGISVDRADPSRLYLATHNGVYAVSLDGGAKRISADQNDYMGFAPHPADPAVLFASGHPAGGGNMGVLKSTDRGKSWQKISDGLNGPVDFHQMDVSKADPKVIYGISRGVQVSRDGGLSWTLAGPAPEGVLDLSASAKSAGTVYAATRRGIMYSVDAGKSWSPAHILLRTATMIQVAADGKLYAFLDGSGLIRADEPPLSWQRIARDFGAAFVVHLAVDPTDGAKIYVVTFNPQARAAALMATRNGGKTWFKLGGK